MLNVSRVVQGDRRRGGRKKLVVHGGDSRDSKRKALVWIDGMCGASQFRQRNLQADRRNQPEENVGQAWRDLSRLVPR